MVRSPSAIALAVLVLSVALAGCSEHDGPDGTAGSSGSASGGVGNSGGSGNAAGTSGAGGSVVVPPPAAEWTQDAHDAQRTGFSPIEPEEPWTFVWTFNGSGDTAGSTSGHFYQQPAPYTPWEARTVTGDGRIYIPANDAGLIALELETGSKQWSVLDAAFNAAPAYDPTTRAVFAGADSGTLYKVDAASGAVLGSYAAGAKLNKAVLIAENAVYATAEDGSLHKVDTGSMQGVWTYEAGSPAHTPPAYSAQAGLLVYATADLNVHAVKDADGKQQWKVKPTSREPSYPYEFQASWPVIAEQHGVVFMRMHHGIDLIFGPGEWPTQSAAIRAKLQAEPQWKNLFALDLQTGNERFVPAVGPQGVEDFGENPNLRVHSFPVVRVLEGGTEIAYTTFRSSDTTDPSWDARWDSHVGEMMLDDQSVSGLVAGDVRFIDFTSADAKITDENCPLTMAGDTLFFSHWSGTGAHRITDRSPDKGQTRATAIATDQRPPLLRANTCDCGDFDPATHYSSSCGLQYDHENAGCGGRWFGSPGFYSYYGVLDPPTPKRNAYSEGVLPRYTYVSGRYIVFEGNGGDLVVLRHSGTVP